MKSHNIILGLLVSACVISTTVGFGFGYIVGNANKTMNKAVEILTTSLVSDNFIQTRIVEYFNRQIRTNQNRKIESVDKINETTYKITFIETDLKSPKSIALKSATYQLTFRFDDLEPPNKDGVIYVIDPQTFRLGYFYGYAPNGIISFIECDTAKIHNERIADLQITTDTCESLPGYANMPTKHYVTFRVTEIE